MRQGIECSLIQRLQVMSRSVPLLGIATILSPFTRALLPIQLPRNVPWPKRSVPVNGRLPFVADGHPDSKQAKLTQCYHVHGLGLKNF